MVLNEALRFCIESLRSSLIESLYSEWRTTSFITPGVNEPNLLHETAKESLLPYLPAWLLTPLRTANPVIDRNSPVELDLVGSDAIDTDVSKSENAILAQSK